MHIEINAGGLGGGIAIAEYQSNMSSFISDVESMISSFKAVSSSTYALNGGVGTLQSAVSDISSRVQAEVQKKNDAVAIQKKSNDFLDLAIRVDNQVSTIVNNNKEEFYRVNPWLKPATSVDEEVPWYEQAWNWLCGAGEAITDGAKQVWNWVSDTAVKAWNGIVEFYQEHKKIIDTILIVVGAIAAISAVVASGGGALIFLLGALGCTPAVAAAISGAVAVIAVVSTVGSASLNILDIWCEIDNPTFQALKKGFNIISTASNLIYSIGSIYNAFHHISPAQAKMAMEGIKSGTRGAIVNGQPVSFLSDYQPGADSAINRELLSPNSQNHFYNVKMNNGANITVSADPCTASGVGNISIDPSKEYIVLSGTHGGELGQLSYQGAKAFYLEDCRTFANMSNVKVINIQDHVVIDTFGRVINYNKPFMDSIFSSGKDIICAWCYSDRSLLIKTILGVK